MLKNSANRLRGLAAADIDGDLSMSDLLALADTLEKFAGKTAAMAVTSLGAKGDSVVQAAGGMPRTARRREPTDPRHNAQRFGAARTAKLHFFFFTTRV